VQDERDWSVHFLHEAGDIAEDQSTMKIAAEKKSTMVEGCNGLRLR
jgi:hypothetical protein